jgi:hypothetical protein
MEAENDSPYFLFYSCEYSAVILPSISVYFYMCTNNRTLFKIFFTFLCCQHDAGLVCETMLKEKYNYSP